MQRLLTAEHGPQAIVMVTHDLSLAHRFANRVVLVADGRLVADGPPAEILESADTMRRARLDPIVVPAGDHSLDG